MAERYFRGTVTGYKNHLQYKGSGWRVKNSKYYVMSPKQAKRVTSPGCKQCNYVIKKAKSENRKVIVQQDKQCRGNWDAVAIYKPKKASTAHRKPGLQIINTPKIKKTLGLR